MSPYRKHQIDMPEPWYARAFEGLLAFVDIAWPFLVAAVTLLLVATGAWWVADAAETVQKGRAAALSTEAPLVVHVRGLPGRRCLLLRRRRVRRVRGQRGEYARAVPALCAGRRVCAAMNDEPTTGILCEWTPSTARVGLELTVVSVDAPICGTTLECGGECCLVPGHDGKCSCCGDYAEPGDCPA